jgi:type I restriction-modification system DNA methylase subunit
MNADEQQFLNDLDKKLWTAANKLLPMLDAAVYKHVVLGLIFLKYVSDAFQERRAELEAAFRDPGHDYFLGDDGEDLIREELEARDYYTEKNVFWVPALARWDFIRSHAKVAVGLIVEMLQPYQGRVYDPCCGSGGFFVQSEKFVEEHGGRIGQLSVYGQESNPTTSRPTAAWPCCSPTAP